MISKRIFCLSHCQASVTMEIPHPLTDTHTHNSCSERPLQRPEEERESRLSAFFCPKEAFKKVRATTSMVHIFSNGVRAEKKNRKRRKKDFRMMGMMDLCNSTERESNTAFNPQLVTHLNSGSRSFVSTTLTDHKDSAGYEMYCRHWFLSEQPEG